MVKTGSVNAALILEAMLRFAVISGRVPGDN
jgi:hypothetical protein